MAGQYFNETRVNEALMNWLGSVTESKTSWQANNLHIDEIEGFQAIKRDDWIDSSFSVFNLLKKIKLPESLIIFLHIDLSYSTAEQNPEVISESWLRDNIDEYTPPSFNCTTFDYYNEFYKKELTKCTADDIRLSYFDSDKSMNFFYRTYYHETEEMYSRELYLFFIPLSSAVLYSGVS